MKHYHPFFQLLVGFALAAFGAAGLLAQDCPCPGAGAGWFSERHEMMHPEFMSEFPSGEFGNYARTNNMAACSGPFCGYSCRAEGLVFSAEMTLADVWQRDRSDIAARFLAIQTPAAPAIDNLDPRVDSSPLITFGYMTCEGLGFQGRFWEFDTIVSQGVTPPGPADPNLVTHAWDATVFDMEVTYSSIYDQGWDIMLSGGYRFTEYEEGATLRRDNTQLASVRTRYIGSGLTGAVALRRQITNRFSLMANPRVSYLLGGESITPSSGLNLPPQPLNDTFDPRYVLETKVGVSYECPICGGGVWFTRGGYEVQYWNDFVPSLDSQTRRASTILNGFFFAVGLQR